MVLKKMAVVQQNMEYNCLISWPAGPERAVAHG